METTITTDAPQTVKRNAKDKKKKGLWSRIKEAHQNIHDDARKQRIKNDALRGRWM